MLKSEAIERLGGSVTAAAEAIGITTQAVSQWPELLPRRIEDRVLAVLARKHLPSAMLGEESAPRSDPSAPPPAAPGAPGGVERRDPGRVNAFPDLDRRAPVEG